MTYIGAALDELDGKLRRGRFLDEMSPASLTIMILTTDGFANDDCEAANERIHRNECFEKGVRPKALLCTCGAGGNVTGSRATLRR